MFIRLTIEELYERISGLPRVIDVYKSDGNHYWGGNYYEAPEEVKRLLFTSSKLENGVLKFYL